MGSGFCVIAENIVLKNTESGVRRTRNAGNGLTLRVFMA